MTTTCDHQSCKQSASQFVPNTSYGFTTEIVINVAQTFALDPAGIALPSQREDIFTVHDVLTAEQSGRNCSREQFHFHKSLPLFILNCILTTVDNKKPPLNGLK